MDLETAVRNRRSIRQFTRDAVSEQTIAEILDLARWTPSWANTQAWNVFAVTGASLEKIKAAYRELSAANADRSFEIARPRPDWPPELAERTRQLIASRTTPKAATAPASTVTDFYDAPWLLLFAIDERLQPEYACFDIGALAQTVCLASQAKGLGTCIMAMAVGYPDVLHAHVPAAAGKRFVIGVSVGVPDLTAPINTFERQRTPLAEIVSFRE
jgi:nitroreductase